MGFFGPETLGGGGFYKPSFTPATIPDLKAWFRSDAGVVLDTTSGTTTVSQWTDQSGNGTHMTQSTKSLQPLFVDNVQAGKPALQFDAVDDVLNMVAGGLSLSRNVAGLTVFAVHRTPVSTSGGQSVFRITRGGSTTSDRLGMWRNTSGNQFLAVRRLDADAYSQMNATTRQYNASHFFLDCALANYSTRDTEYYLNGLLSGSSSTTILSSGNTENTDSGYIGTGVSTHYVREYLEILIFARAISSTERQLMESYLNTKYRMY